MRRAGIDPGSVRTGVAIADDEVPVATPLCTVEHRGLEDAVRKVSEVLARENVQQAVIGLPLSLDGREGEAARKSKLFAQRLEAAAKIPVVLWDERLTSTAANRALSDPSYHRGDTGSRGRPSRSRRNPNSRDRGQVDRMAATLILQSYLDSQREHPWQDPLTTDPQDKDPHGGGRPG
ncbi:MAG TPA: Holliday junction resolvase RuvX [Polyangiales bacterium]|jgi:putative Holliday junction resolvase|nr:Holliday junction resolvase RuvX [Polyangiales bacterium]